jgi:3-oxoacyl-[acyl-carrier-protein] synthase I
MGACTAIGRSVWSSAAAARAAVCGFTEHPSMIDRAGEPMLIARAPWIDPSLSFVERVCGLLLPAVNEAMSGISRVIAHDSKVGCVLALPGVRPGRDADLDGKLRARLSESFGGRLLGLTSYEDGHAAGFRALDAASIGLSSGSLDACVVAGVDSYLTSETLEWLEACDQLHGAGLHNNAWGFIPGEAAAAIVLSTEPLVARFGLRSYGHVVGIGLGDETNLIKTDSVCIGDGLTRAFRGALEHVAADEVIDDVFCDLNGETYRADEYGFAALRTKTRFRAATDFVAPADCWGDIGAAGATLHMCLGLIAHAKMYAHGPLSLSCGSSETGTRGAAVVRAAEPR